VSGRGQRVRAARRPDGRAGFLASKWRPGGGTVVNRRGAANARLRNLRCGGLGRCGAWTTGVLASKWWTAGSPAVVRRPRQRRGSTACWRSRGCAEIRTSRVTRYADSVMEIIGNVSTEGGPFLLADAMAVRSWRGTADGSDHYDRLCEVLSRVGPGWGAPWLLGDCPAVFWEPEGEGTADVLVTSSSSLVLVRGWFDGDWDAGTLAAARVQRGKEQLLGDMEISVWSSGSAVVARGRRVCHRRGCCARSWRAHRRSLDCGLEPALAPAGRPVHLQGRPGAGLQRRRPSLFRLARRVLGLVGSRCSDFVRRHSRASAPPPRHRGRAGRRDRRVPFAASVMRWIRELSWARRALTTLSTAPSRSG
jgi:hypothetical protein